jgi:hypothetical protein
MSRDNFISDNLIKIRENLRQNPVKTGAADGLGSSFPVQNSSAREDSAGKSAEITFASELPQPAPRMQTRTPELDRDRRELAGRIRRDYSCVAAELENMEMKRREAAVFLEFLQKHQRELESMDFSAEGSSRELDRLAWEYYRMAGRWRAFSSGTSVRETPGAEGGPREAAGKTALWGISVAILLGAVIVSIALLVSFL